MLPGAADATGILQRFARQLGAEEPENDRAGLLAQIYEQLAIVREDGRHAVLMVDDAQVMTPAVFAELGGILNLEYEDRRLVSILFVGSPDLDRLVQNDPSMSPRVDVRVRLQPLDMANTTAYLAHRLAAVKGNPQTVPAYMIETLYKFGRGRPRLLNTLADNALFEAYLAGRDAIEPGDVERAAMDLGIGPDPGSTFSQPSTAELTLGSSATGAAATAERNGRTHESLAELDLTQEVAAPVEVSPIATGDLDAGLEAALEDFETVGSAAIGDRDRSLGADALEFDDSTSTKNATKATTFESEPDFVMAEAEFAPLEAGDDDQFDDIFVELIEE